MNWNQFCNAVFDITPTFTILNSKSALTIKRNLLNVQIIKTPTDILQPPSEEPVLQEVITDNSPLTDMNVVDIITEYTPYTIRLNNCPYLWFDKQRFDILKQEENEYYHTQIVAMAKDRTFLFLFQLDDYVTFIAKLKLPFDGAYYNLKSHKKGCNVSETSGHGKTWFKYAYYARIIYNDLYQALIANDDDYYEPNFSNISNFITFIAKLKAPLDGIYYNLNGQYVSVKLGKAWFVYDYYAGIIYNDLREALLSDDQDFSFVSNFITKIFALPQYN